MYPELFTLNLPLVGSLTVTSFGVMLWVAMLAGYWVLRAEFARLGQAPVAVDVLLAGIIGGIVGAKLYYLVLHLDQTAQNPAASIFSRAGIVWYGGFIGGFLAVTWVLRRRGIAWGIGADAVAPALALSYAVGRVGCFLVGDDYGRPTDSFVGVAFPEGFPPSTAGNLRGFGADVDTAIPDTEVLAVHPTQLYETALSTIFFVMLWRLRGHRRPRGWLFGVWMIMSGAGRFVVEIFRAKDDRFLGTFTVAQAISVALLVAGVVLVTKLWRERAARLQPAA